MTPLFGSKVYGPWSDERLSAFEFMGMVSSTLSLLFECILDPFLKVATDGLASFGFSPCYNCSFAYQFKIGGGSENKDISIFVDGILSVTETALFNPLRYQRNFK